MTGSATVPTPRVSRPALRRSRLQPVAFAVLAALVPASVVAWAVGRNAARDASRSASASVALEAQAAGRGAQRVLARAEQRAVAIARTPRVQRALARRDREALARFARHHPGIGFRVGGRVVPPSREGAAVRSAVVTLGGKPIGTVIVSVPSARLLPDLRLENEDRVVLAAAGRVPERPSDVTVAGRRYRAAAAPVSNRLQVVAARPLSAIDDDVRNVWLIVVGAALATLATVALIAWVAAPLVVRGRIAHRERSEALRVLSNVRDGVFLTDGDGVVRFWNRAAERITGLSAEDVWGKRLAELPGLGVLAGGIPVDEEARATPATYPVQLGLRELWLSLAGVEIPEGTVYTFTDVTEEQRLEQLKNDFVSTVSHELRTPLAGLYGAALTLSERGTELPEADRARLLSMLGDQAEQLARVVEDVLVAAGIESERLLLAEERFDASALAREVVDDARLRYSSMRVQLVEAEDVEAVGDRVRTRQVLENLIDNAMKYATQGPVRVAVERGVDTAVFSVSDEGPGIPEDVQERIFEKFYRSDVQMEGGVGGTGLGLYISRELVRRMGGRLWVESTPRAGSMFAVELPAISR